MAEAIIENYAKVLPSSSLKRNRQKDFRPQRVTIANVRPSLDSGALQVTTMFASAISGRPLPQLLYKNPTLRCGMNIVDFIHVQRIPRVLYLWSIEKQGEQNLAEMFGVVTLDGRPIHLVSDLWALYVAARRDLVETLTDSRFQNGIIVEDVLLMRAMVEQGILKGNLSFRETRERDSGDSTRIEYVLHGDRSSQNLTDFLNDLAACCAILPADDVTREFLVNFGTCDGDELCFPYRTTHTVAAFLRERAPLSHNVWGEFSRRIRTQYVPEFKCRFWGQFAVEMNRLRVEALSEDGEECAKSLRALGVLDDVIVAIGDPSRAFQNLIDTVKNTSSLASLPKVD